MYNCSQRQSDQMTYILGFEFWESWTSARWVKERNPTIDMTDREYRNSEWAKYSSKKPKVERGTIVRYNAIDKEWKAI